MRRCVAWCGVVSCRVLHHSNILSVPKYMTAVMVKDFMVTTVKMRT